MPVILTVQTSIRWHRWTISLRQRPYADGGQHNAAQQEACTVNL